MGAKLKCSFKALLTLIRKVFDKGMRILIMTRVKVQSSTSYHILLVDFGELLMELYAIKVASGYQI
jgi:hypothetical protein